VNNAGINPISVRLRAESPVINSTGQRPVVFGRKCNLCAVRHNMLVKSEISCTIPPSVPSGTECITGNIIPFSLFYPHSVPNGTGVRRKGGHLSTNILCLRHKGRSTFRTRPGNALWIERICCLVLLITGLSALAPTAIDRIRYRTETQRATEF
jgi:hypothetical protein